MTAKTQKQAPTGNPTSNATHFEFTTKAWKPGAEFKRFEDLTRQLVKTPKQTKKS